MEVIEETPLDAAQRLVDVGVSVIPIGTNKRPAIDKWKPFQERLPKGAELRQWFAKGQNGLAIVAGAVSGNIEIPDFDDPTTIEPWTAMVEGVQPGLVDRLPIVRTPSGGQHLYWRCASIEGSQKLAESAARKTMIETRGEGGYALIPPSPARCHPEGKEYVLGQGDLADIPTITEDERDPLLNCARALTMYVEPERVYEPKEGTTANGERPGDLYAASVTWGEILKPHDWTLVTEYWTHGMWRRPGKKWGISATTGYNGGNLLYVFSSNAKPFEPQTGYSKFTAYALLNHGGDFKKAAAALVAAGYVKPPKEEDDQELVAINLLTGEEEPATKEEVEYHSFWNPFRQLEWRRRQKPETIKEPPRVVPASEFFAEEDGDIEDLMYWGPFLFQSALTFLVGESSAGKTVFLYRLAQALAAGKPFLGFAPPRPLHVLHIDLESNDWMARNIGRSLGTVSPNWTLIWGQATFDEMITLGKGYDVIIIDSLQTFDKPKDENSNSEGNAQMEQFHQIIKETGAALILTHNAGKNSGPDRFKGRGASVRIDRSDVVINMDVGSDEPEKQTRKLTIVKTRVVGIGEKLEYRFVGDKDFMLTKGLYVANDQTKAMAQRISGLQSQLSNIERSRLLKTLDIKDGTTEADTVDRALKLLVRQERLQKGGKRGEYKWTKGPAEENPLERVMHFS